MFSTIKTRIILGVYIFLILSIPVGAYLASEYQVFKSSASEGKKSLVKNTPLPSSSPLTTTGAKELLSVSQSNLLADPNATEAPPSPDASSPTIATSFGPTLSLKINIDGRPKDNQATKLFVGIVEGSLSQNPKFLLSFSVNVGKDGTYSNLSLAGLTAGSSYTALLKGSAQIASASTFVMSPTVTNLNGGEAVNLLTGDLNEDNIINQTDYSIVQKVLGKTTASSNWNENADLNKDGVINLFDLTIINKNLGQTGESGAWTSPLPQVSTASASLLDQSSKPVGGYWMWIPK